MLKTYELREIIESSLSNFQPSEKWEEFLTVETETVSHDTILVNFTELSRNGLFENKYKIIIEPVND